MPIYGNNEIITENFRDDTDEITKILPVFYEHVLKSVTYKYVTGSWKGSINNAIKKIEIKKSKVPSVYKAYNISDHINKIDEKVKKKLVDNNNDLTKFDFSKVYEDFNTLDKVIDRPFVCKYIGLNGGLE